MLLPLSVCLSLSLRYNGHFQVNLGKPMLIEAKDDGSGGDNC